MWTATGRTDRLPPKKGRKKVSFRPKEDKIHMAIRNIVIQGDPLLTKRCRPVTEFNARLHQLLDDMRDTLTEAQGAGLAAPQVGVLRRVVVVMDDEDQLLELVNPEIVSQSGEQTGPEGCLSVPGKWGMVTRPDHVKIRAQDRQGHWFEQTGEGLMAQAMVHEYEHLDGHAFKEDPTFTPVSEEELEAMTNGEG